MGQLILDLVPLALGVALSPLAIMALVAVLLSERARVNGVMYLIGWAAAIVAVLAISYGLLGQLQPNRPATTPDWVLLVKIVLGLGLIAAAVWEYRKGHAKIVAMAEARTPSEVAAAAPQLPGWLQAVATFTAFRSLLLGFGIFVLNPVDVSCALLAGLDVHVAVLPPASSLVILIVFAVVGALPIAVPVVLMLVMGGRAEKVLKWVRSFISSHSEILNAGMLLVIGALQLQKGLSGLIG